MSNPSPSIRALGYIMSLANTAGIYWAISSQLLPLYLLSLIGVLVGAFLIFANSKPPRRYSRVIIIRLTQGLALLFVTLVSAHVFFAEDKAPTLLSTIFVAASLVTIQKYQARLIHPLRPVANAA